MRKYIRHNTTYKILAIVLTILIVLFGISYSPRQASSDETNALNESQTIDADSSGQMAEIFQQRQSLTSTQHKIDWNLMQQVREIREISTLQSFSFQNFSTSAFKINNQGVIEVKLTVPVNISDEQINQLKDLGMDVKITLPKYGIVEGRLPYDAVETVASLEFVNRVGTPAYPIYDTGLVTSAGDSVLKADLARSTFGINGSGSKIGVISDGVDHLSNAIASGDLPADVQVLQGGSGDEGTAMLEIIYDLAPGADLAFYSPTTSSDMIMGIGALEAAGCNIIVDDIKFFDEPKFEDGPIAQRALEFVNDGGVYVTSAGNGRLRHYSSAYDRSACSLGDYSFAHDYNSSPFIDWGNNFTIPNGSSIVAILQWNNEVGNSSMDDFDFWLLNQWGNDSYADSCNDQSGGSYTSPWEEFEYTNNTGSTINVTLVITEYSLVSAPASIVLDYQVYYCPSLLQYNTTNDSVIGHAAVEEVLSTAAVSASTPEILESYSSCGPGTIYFPAYEQRQVPNITGTDGVNTEIGLLGYFDNPFYGTSAAAPHIAAIAALVWDANPSLNSSQVRNAITSTAVDLSTAGFDYNSGWGRANASAAVNSTVFTLNISSSSGGTVTTPGVGTFHPYIGQVVNISATPDSCYHFVNWSPDTGTIANPTSPSTTITMNASYSIQANFAASDTFGGGDGTPGDPFLIIDTWNLQAMSCNLSAHYALNNSIDALATSGWNSGLGFLPVGNDSNQFTGSFDGRGYEITDLYINRSDTDYVGLFGYINSGTVTNTSLVDTDIIGKSFIGRLAGYSYNSSVNDSYTTGNVSGTNYMGGLLGYSYNSSVNNSYATGNVSGNSDYVGGLIGYNHNSSINNSYATGNVSGNSIIGGFIGYNEGYIWANSYISNSHATVTVSGTGDYIGGFLGYNYGSVDHSYATGNVSGTTTGAGGLIGYSYNSSVNNSYATGNVNGTNYMGGLIGYGYNSSINNSYATGNVSGTAWVGGLIGDNIAAGSLVSNSYATGHVSGTSDVGGLLGKNYGSVSSSFWDTDTSGQTTSDGGTGKNTSEMKSFLTYFNAGWDLFCEDDNGTEDIWRIDETCTDNNGYPSLWWQGLTHNASVTLTISSGGNGSTAPAAGVYPYNCSEVVNIVATADPFYIFVNWSGPSADSVSNVNAASTNISMNGSKTIQANFIFVPGPGITVNPTSGLVTTEAGGTDTFTIVLNTLPTADVVINLSSSDLTEGTVSPASVTFTNANWSTPQTVTATGVDDLEADGDIVYTIVTANASSTDPDYNDLNEIDVGATNNDNDVAGITVNPTSGLVTTEAGGTDTFTIVLNTLPTADVVINLTSSDTTEGTVSPASVTFSTTNWSTPQTVTATGVDDLEADGDIVYTIVTANASSTDPSYSGRNSTDVSVTNTDNDTEPWDINDDGNVNVLDMILIGQHWEETGSPGWIPEDVNSDGTVNVLDMIVIGQHWTG